MIIDASGNVTPEAIGLTLATKLIMRPGTVVVVRIVLPSIQVKDGAITIPRGAPLPRHRAIRGESSPHQFVQVSGNRE